MAFTSYCDLYQALLDKQADGEMHVGQVVKGDKSVTYRSMDEFFRLLTFYQQKCREEQGLITRRTYAGNAGRAS